MLAEGFLQEFDAEMAATRRLLERVPADGLRWGVRVLYDAVAGFV